MIMAEPGTVEMEGNGQHVGTGMHLDLWANSNL
jgi:hypothetical protein